MLNRNILFVTSMKRAASKLRATPLEKLGSVSPDEFTRTVYGYLNSNKPISTIHGLIEKYITIQLEHAKDSMERYVLCSFLKVLNNAYTLCNQVTPIKEWQLSEDGYAI